MLAITNMHSKRGSNNKHPLVGDFESCTLFVAGELVNLDTKGMGLSLLGSWGIIPLLILCFIAIGVEQLFVV